MNVTILGQLNSGKSTMSQSLKTEVLHHSKLPVYKSSVTTWEFNLVQDDSFSISHFKEEFNLIDTPDPEVHLNEVIRASVLADIGVIVIDALKEDSNEFSVKVDRRTRDFIHIFGGLGISKLVVLINKMDAVDYDQQLFDSYSHHFLRYSDPFRYWEEVLFIPVCSVQGDNISHKSENLRWYHGETFFEAIRERMSKAENRGPNMVAIVLDEPDSLNVMDRMIYIENGDVDIGTVLHTYPGDVHLTVDQLTNLNNEFIEKSENGSIVTATFDAQVSNLEKGTILTNLDNILVPLLEISAEIIMFNISEEIYEGFTTMIYFNNGQQILCVLENILQIIEPENDENPPFIRIGEKALVKIKCTSPLYSLNGKETLFVTQYKGTIIATGRST